MSLQYQKYIKPRMADPEYRKMKFEYVREYRKRLRNDDEYKKKNAEMSKRCYHTNEHYREQQKLRARAWQARESALFYLRRLFN